MYVSRDGPEKALQEAFADAKDQHKKVVASGFAGSGKSQLVINYVLTSSERKCALRGR